METLVKHEEGLKHKHEFRLIVMHLFLFSFLVLLSLIALLPLQKELRESLALIRLYHNIPVDYCEVQNVGSTWKGT